MRQWSCNGENLMDDKQAKILGTYLRDQRVALGLSTRELAAQAEVDDSTIVRFEQGAYGAPRPDKLARIAEALGLSLSNVYALAEYAVPDDLPSPALYLRTKFRDDLSATRMKSLTRELHQLLMKHGLDPAAGPAPGEDEVPEAATTRSKKTTRPRTKKGGSP